MSSDGLCGKSEEKSYTSCKALIANRIRFLLVPRSK
jgi:hypothetical protein